MIWIWQMRVGLHSQATKYRPGIAIEVSCIYQKEDNEKQLGREDDEIGALQTSKERRLQPILIPENPITNACP